MRPDRKIVTDHTLLTDVSEADHHPPVETFSLAINSQVIAGVTAWEWRGSVLAPGHKVMRVILRGEQNVNIQGHTGVFVVASDTPGAVSAIALKPYGAGGYYTSYMGGYSRLHGDSYLTPNLFGGNVRLRDAYFDSSTNEPVLEFFNAGGSPQAMKVYGTGVVK